MSSCKYQATFFLAGLFCQLLLNKIGKAVLCSCASLER